MEGTGAFDIQNAEGAVQLLQRVQRLENWSKLSPESTSVRGPPFQTGRGTPRRNSAKGCSRAEACCPRSSSQVLQKVGGLGLAGRRRVPVTIKNSILSLSPYDLHFRLQRDAGGCGKPLLLMCFNEPQDIVKGGAAPVDDKAACFSLTWCPRRRHSP